MEKQLPKEGQFIVLREVPDQVKEGILEAKEIAWITDESGKIIPAETLPQAQLAYLAENGIATYQIANKQFQYDSLNFLFDIPDYFIEIVEEKTVYINTGIWYLTIDDVWSAWETIMREHFPNQVDLFKAYRSLGLSRDEAVEKVGLIGPDLGKFQKELKKDG